jgi:TolA-binding protein
MPSGEDRPMVDETRIEQLRRRLRDIDAEIAELRGSTDGLKGDGDGVEDAEEIAAGLTGVEEREAVLGILAQRRESLSEQLKQLSYDA